MKGLIVLIILISVTLCRKTQEPIDFFAYKHNDDIILEDLFNKQDFQPYKRARIIDMDHLEYVIDSLKIGDIININLFNENKYFANIDRINISIHGSISVRARLDEYSMGYMIVTKSCSFVLGSIRIPEKNELYVVKTDKNSGISYLKEVDVYQLEFFKDEVEIPPF